MMQKNKFKAGDQVVCRMAEGFNIDLVHGQKYTIERTEGPYVALVEVPGALFLHWRFKNQSDHNAQDRDLIGPVAVVIFLAVLGFYLYLRLWPQLTTLVVWGVFCILVGYLMRRHEDINRRQVRVRRSHTINTNSVDIYLDKVHMNPDGTTAKVISRKIANINEWRVVRLTFFGRFMATKQDREWIQTFAKEANPINSETLRTVFISAPSN